MVQKGPEGRFLWFKTCQGDSSSGTNKNLRAVPHNAQAGNINASVLSETSTKCAVELSIRYVFILARACPRCIVWSPLSYIKKEPEEPSLWLKKYRKNRPSGSLWLDLLNSHFYDRAALAFDVVSGNGYGTYVFILGNFIHDVEHEFLDDGAECSGTRVFFYCLLCNGS